MTAMVDVVAAAAAAAAAAWIVRPYRVELLSMVAMSVMK